MEKTGEYYSLVYGQLRNDFGLVDPKPIMDDIISAIQTSVRVEIKKPTTDSFGGIYIGIYKDDFSDAMSAYESKYESINSKGEATLVDWLNWLLFRGDSIVISDYGIFGHARSRSRSESGHIMIRAVGKKTTPFRVQPIFAGTKDNNWITRAAQFTAVGIQEFLEKQVQVLNG